MKELHVYDFDGTLFRSPEKPEGFVGGWWSNSLSLSPPYVPDVTDASWWINSVVQSAKQSNSNSEVLSILLTGRIQKNGLPSRIQDLLWQAHLNFDEVHLNPGSETTAFKTRLVGMLLSKHPTIKVVRVWEDNKKNLDALRNLASQWQLEFDPHFIQASHTPKVAMNHSDTKLYGVKISQFFQAHLGKFTTADALNLHNGLLILLQGIHSNSQVPKDISQDLTKAVKFFSKRVPSKDYYRWESEAQDHITKVIDALLLPESKQGTQVGPFTLINGAHATQKEIEVATQALSHAATLIQTHSLRGMGQILYGDVHIVGKLHKPSIQAWYFQKADNISIVKRKTIDKEFLWSLLHEIAHRYYIRYADATDIEDWQKYHQYLKATTTLPKVGDKLYGVVGEPIIVRYEDGKAILDSGKYLTPQDMKKISLWNQYPTAYAATDPSEHFSEAFAAYCFNKLKLEAKVVFEGIWK